MAKPSRLGIRVKAFRRQRDLTQEELSKESGVSRAVIAGLESGIRRSIMVATLERLARALRTDLNQLTGFNPLGEVEDAESEALGATA